MANPVRLGAALQRVQGVSTIPYGYGAVSIASPNAQVDRVTFSPAGLRIGRLLRMWGTLSQLFGDKPNQGPDLEGLRAAIIQAQKNLAAMQTNNRVIDTLKSSVLQQSEALVSKYYGLQGDGAPLQVALDDQMGNALAAVSYMYDRRGRMVNEVLHLNMSQFVPDTSPNGTNQHIIQNDRIIAHEITHAIMGRNMDWRNLPEWFKEGTAEYIAGAGERAHLALEYLSPQQLVSHATADWQGDSPQYAGAYLAVRFLDVMTADGGGLKAIMGRLKAGDSLDTAIAQVSKGAFPNTESFLRQWEQQGVAFLRSLDLSGKDPGAIDQAKGPDVVPDLGHKANQPMQGFRIIWPSPLEGSLLFGQAPAVADTYQRLMPNRPQRPLGEWI